MAVPFYSAMLHSGMPAPQSTQPILPAASLYRTVLSCSALPVQIHSGLLVYRLNTASPCRSILLGFIPASPAIPYLLPVHTAPKPIDLVHLLQPKKHAQHISPLCDARQPIKQPTDAVGNISQSNIPLLTILKYTSLVYDRAALAIVPLRPSAARLLHALSVKIQKIPAHYTAAIRSLCAEPHIKTGW